MHTLLASLNFYLKKNVITVFMDLTTSLMYQLKIAGAKMRTCQESDLESGLQCLNSDTNVCTKFCLFRESRRQLRDALLSERNLYDVTLKTWSKSLQGEKWKVPFSLSLEPGDHFSAPGTHQTFHQPAGPWSGKLLNGSHRSSTHEHYTCLGWKSVSLVKAEKFLNSNLLPP